MNQDREHLRLLAIFHYVGAGLAALFSLFPLLYTTIGAIFIFAARHPSAAGPKPGEELPPEFLGWIFAVVGLLLFLLGIAMAICILLAGRCLSRNKHYTFALVMACIECLFIPFGTILGIFTIIFAFVFTRDRDGHLYFACRTMPVPQQALHLCAGNGLYRMSLHSFRNNSRDLYDYCAFERARERVVCRGANAGLKIARL